MKLLQANCLEDALGVVGFSVREILRNISQESSMIVLGVCWHCSCHPLRVDALLQVDGLGKNQEFAEHLAKEFEVCLHFSLTCFDRSADAVTLVVVSSSSCSVCALCQ